jgi:predicted extracellular nuclease
VELQEGALHYTLPIAELDATLGIGDRVWLWADTQYRGIGDRAPTPETADGCGEPESAAEALALDLVPLRATVINEVLYDGPGADSDDAFTEISAAPGTSLDGWSLVGVNGGDGAAYRVVDLSGAIVPADGLLVVATSSAAGEVLTARDLTGSVDWQNGPDAVVLLDAEGQVVDALQYGDAGPNNAGEGSPAPDVAGGDSLSRDASHTDSDDNLADFAPADPTPGAP